MQQKYWKKKKQITIAMQNKYKNILIIVNEFSQILCFICQTRTSTILNEIYR